MAEMRPFKGYRYTLAKPEDLGNLIAPPYDMLDEEKIEALYRKDPLNAVRIDQNRRESSDTATIDRHRRAGALFDEWVGRGALRLDGLPSLYIYEQQFTIERAGAIERCERTGVVALVKLVDFEEDVVLPHEQTLSGPKTDRYEHLAATRLNVGQIFGLLADRDGGIFKLIRSMKKGQPLGTAIDGDGVQHSLYSCSDAALIDRFVSASQPSTILIADGHHRYETALEYCRDQGNDPVAAQVMMTLVSTADPGLTIRAFHRLIRKGFGDASVNLRRDLARYFTLVDAGKADSAAVNAFLGGRIDAEMLYVDSTDGRAYGCSLNADGENHLQTTLPGQSLLWKNLDMSRINVIVINRIFNLPLDGKVLHDAVDYRHDAGAALSAALDPTGFHGGFFLRPVSLDTIFRITRGGERMPQKSTNFYPKLYSGLVFHHLGDA